MFLTAFAIFRASLQLWSRVLPQGSEKVTCRHGFYTIYPTFLVVFTLPYQAVQVTAFKEAQKTLLLQI